MEQFGHRLTKFYKGFITSLLFLATVTTQTPVFSAEGEAVPPQSSSDQVTQSQNPDSKIDNQNAPKGCAYRLAQVSLAVVKAPVRVVKWPFKTKRRALITGGVVLGLGAYIAPLYPSNEGTFSPAMSNYYYISDSVKSHGDNKSQLELLNSSPANLTDQKVSDQRRLSEIAESLNQKGTDFPQGVHVPEKKEQQK